MRPRARPSSPHAGRVAAPECGQEPLPPPRGVGRAAPVPVPDTLAPRREGKTNGTGERVSRMPTGKPVGGPLDEPRCLATDPAVRQDRPFRRAAGFGDARKT